MESTALMGFLDDTSLLNTPKSPQKASTSRKENRQIRGQENSSLNFISSCTKNLKKDDDVLNEIDNIISNKPVKKLDLSPNDSSLSAYLSDTNDSSLGLISLENVKDFSFTEFDEPLQIFPKSTEKDEFFESKADEEHTFGALDTLREENEVLKIVETTKLGSSPKMDFNNAGCTLTSDEKMFIMYGETSKRMEKMLAEDDNSHDSRARLTMDEELFILYGAESKAIEEMLVSSEKDINASTTKKTASCKGKEISQVCTLQNAGNDCSTPIAKTMDIHESGLNSFSQILPESPFEQASLVYHNAMTPRFKPNINRWLSNVDASLANEQTLTPSRVNPFSNQSSFQVDDLYNDQSELQPNLDSSENFQLNSKNESQMSVEHNQTIAKPISSNLASESTGATKGIEKPVSLQLNTTYNKEDTNVIPTDQNQFSLDKTRESIQSSCFDSDPYIPNTSLAFCKNILAEFEANEQNFEGMSFFDDNFQSAKEGLEMNYYENSFEQDHLRKMDDSKASQYSTWSVQSQNQLVPRPSWWSEISEEAKSMLSASQFFAARSENLGTLTTDKDRDRPFFGDVVTSPPKSLNCSIRDADNIAREDDTGQDLMSVSSQAINESKVNDTTLVGLVDASTISRIASEISMSDRRSQVADRFLSNVFKKPSKDCRAPKKRNKKGNIETSKNLKKTDLLEKAMDSAGLPYQSHDDTSLGKNFSSTETSKCGHRQESKRHSFGFERYSTIDHTKCNSKDLDGKIKKTFLSQHHNIPNVLPSRTEASYNQRDVPHQPTLPLKLKSNIREHDPLDSKGYEQVMKSSTEIDAKDTEPFINVSTAMLSKNISSDIQRNTTLDVPCLHDSSGTVLNNTFSSLTSSNPESSSTHPCCVHSRPGSSCSSGCTINLQNRLCGPLACQPNYNDPHNPYLFAVIPNMNYYPAMNNLPSVGMMGQSVPCLHSGHFGSLSNVTAPSNLPMQLTLSTALQVQSMPFGLHGSAIGPCVIAPTEYIHPIMCLEDTTTATLELQNPTTRNLFYHLAFKSATLNTVSIPVNSIEATVKDNVFANAGSSVSVPMTFKSSLEGKIQLVLEVVPSFSASKEAAHPTAGSSSSVIVSLEVEKPYISLSSQGKDSLDFGSVIEKGTVTESVSLSFSSRVSFPLWMEVTEESREGHTVSFSKLELCSAADRASVLEWILLTPRRLFCRLIGTEGSPQQKCIRIPVVFQAGKCCEQSIDSVSFVLYTGIGQSANDKLSDSMKILAQVGTVALSLCGSSSKSVIFKTQENAKGVQNLKVINTGTITATVDLAVNCERDDFIVMPPTAILEPSVPVSCNVYFKPTSPDNIKGMLQAALRPCGTIFDLIPVDGRVVSKWVSAAKHSHRNFESQDKHVVDPTVPIIEADKKFLAWGGINIDVQAFKKITLRNTSATTFKATASIKEKNGPFKIIGEKGQRVESLHLELTPFSVRCLKVVFTPTTASIFSSHLIIKPDDSVSDGRFVIPLSGYGGMSEVFLVNFPKDSSSQQHPTLELMYDVDSSINAAFGKVKLRNSGHRAAYVKVILKQDLANEDGMKFEIQPSEFVMLKSQTREVTVNYAKIGDAPYPCSNKKYDGKLIFACGDEILRQKFRRSKYKTNMTLKFNDAIQGIDFNIPFLDEELVPYDETYPDTPKDTNLFHLSMEIHHLNLTIKPQDQNLSLTGHFSALTFVPDVSSCNLSQEDPNVSN